MNRTIKLVWMSSSLALGIVGCQRPANVAPLTSDGASDSSSRHSQEAEPALPKIDAPTGAVLDLVKELDSADREKRFNAAVKLANMGKDARAAIPALVRVAVEDELGEHSFFPSLAAQSALKKIDKTAAIPYLIASLLHDPAAGHREWAATILGEMGPDASSAAVALRDSLYTRPNAVSEADEYACGKAAAALGKIGPRGVEMLAEAITHKNVEVRKLAAWAIAIKVTPQAMEHSERRNIVTTLQIALMDTDRNVRRLAANALGDVTEAASESVIFLEQALETERDGFARDSIADALKRLRAK